VSERRCVPLRGCEYRPPPTLARVRIVSLLPSATEIVCLLGLADQLVGISADSDWPVDVVQRLPVVNSVAIDTSSLSSAEIDAAATNVHRGASLYHVDPELLRELQPDIVLTQEICEVCAVSRRDVELATQALGHRPEVLSLSPVTVDQMLEDVEHVAEVAGVSERGKRVVRALRSRLDGVRARAAALARARVFCMEWLDPPYSAGHWVPEMVGLAGGYDELGALGGPSRRVDWQAVVAYAPDVLVLIPCSLELDRVAAEFWLLGRLPEWAALPAVQSGRVFAGNTHLFSRPGPRLVDGAEVLARMLHPEAFPEPLPAGQALKVASDGQHLVPYA
jgi:iron complex transport system substrate-binding protein